MKTVLALSTLTLAFLAIMAGNPITKHEQVVLTKQHCTTDLLPGVRVLTVSQKRLYSGFLISEEISGYCHRNAEMTLTIKGEKI